MSSLQLIYFLRKKVKVVIFAVQKHVITSTNFQSYILRDFRSFFSEIRLLAYYTKHGEKLDAQVE